MLVSRRKCNGQQQMKLLYTAALLILTVTLTGCNSDIFIEDTGFDNNGELTATIDGDGGSAVFTIPVKGLVSISFDLTSSAAKYCIYYNVNRDRVQPGIPASELGMIVFDNDYFGYSLTKNGDRLTVESQASPFFGNKIVIRLEYDYAIRFITVNVKEGRPIEFLGATYNSELNVTDNAKVITRSTTFHNNSSLQQTLDIYPYLQEQASILIDNLPYESWVKSERLTMLVPVMEDGKWTLRDKEGIMPGTAYKYMRPDYDMTEIIDIPPYTSVKILTEITYSMATAPCTLIFCNQALEREIEFDCTVTSYYPVSYKTRIENAQ